MSDRSIESRLARLEALEAIRELKAAYCRYCDDQYNPDKLVTLFTEDAVWAAAHRGRMVGRQAIHQWFASVSAKIPFAAHLVMNEQITIDGDHARGRWRMVMAAMESRGNGPSAVWSLGDYDETYVRQGGQWLISHLSVSIDLLDPETGVWTRRR